MSVLVDTQKYDEEQPLVFLSGDSTEVENTVKKRGRKCLDLSPNSLRIRRNQQKQAYRDKHADSYKQLSKEYLARPEVKERRRENQRKRLEKASESKF